MSSVADILAARKPRQQRVRFLFDGDLAAELDRTRQALRSALVDQSALASDEVSTLRQKLSDLESAADAATVEFVFAAIGRARLDELKAQNPPTEEMWARYRERVKANPLMTPPEFDPEAMAPALIAASCVDPSMTVDEAQKLWDELSDGEAARLFEAAWNVNSQGSDRPLSKTAISGI